MRWLWGRCRSGRADRALPEVNVGAGSSHRIELIGHVAAGLAHDVNNLLTVVLSCCEPLEQRLSSDDPDRQCILEIRRAAEQGALLTRHVLAFVRGDCGPKQPIELVSLVRASRSVLERLAGGEVKVLFDLPEVARVVNGHPGQLQQVLLNLATNARDAMPAGGTLTLELRDVPATDPLLRGRAGGAAQPHVLLAMTDTGTGMDDRATRHLFEPLFTTKPLGRGTGLGLSIVARVVAETGGFIEVFTRPGVGTRFEIYLPAASDPPDCGRAP